MLGAFLLLQLMLWTATTHAFFPFIACEPGKSCSGPSRRGVDDGLATPRSKRVTFDLWHRGPEANEDADTHSARVVRLAGRIGQKYASLEAPGGSAPALAARANEYNVVKALGATAPKSDGILSDGTDYSYFLVAKFGSSQKPVYMLVDSGAGSTWVMGSTCKSDACKMHNFFGPDDSKTLKVDDKPFEILYGTGHVQGYTAHDSIEVAGMKLEMKFGLANETSDAFTHFPFDGILGLSMGVGSTDNFMGLLVDKKLIDKRIFSVNIARAEDGINNGQITFGGADPSKYTGEISYHEVTDKASGDWIIMMDDFALNGKTSGIPKRRAYIDTGTSFAFGPKDDVAAFHKLIPGAKTDAERTMYDIPCSTPDVPLTVTFSGKTYTISPKDWITRRSRYCRSNIYGLEVVKDSWLFGDLFLKNVYTVFDGAEKRIGFAVKAPLPDVPKASVITPSPSETDALGIHPPTTSPISPDTSAAAPPAGQQSEGTAKPSSSTTQISLADQVGSSAYVSVICVVAVLAMVA